MPMRLQRKRERDEDVAAFRWLVKRDRSLSKAEKMDAVYFSTVWLEQKNV